MAPRRTRLPNPISSARELFSIVSEMSFDDLREAALRAPRIAVIGPTVEEARRDAEAIFGPEARVWVVAQGDREPWPRHADIVMLDRRARVADAVWNERIVEFTSGEPFERARQAAARVGDDLELSLGRRFPVMRHAAAAQVIHATTRANGQFAVVSNLPALVPVVGGVLAAGADTIVLTKNQLMMIYKLAAIHGRDIDNRWRIYQEMIPVVGAGLFWRTVARDLAAMLPFAAGAAPKVAIAVAGTYAAGMMAHVYYLEGKRASAARVREFYQQGLNELRELPGQIRSRQQRRNRTAGESTTIIDAGYTTDTSARMP